MKLNIRSIDTPPDSEPVIISPSTEAQPTRRLMTPSTALNGFRVALDAWFPHMDERMRVQATQMAEDWRPPSPKKRIAE